MIVATDRNGAIGKDNTLPWHSSRELNYFKEFTTGKVVIMGRKTHESIGRALPNRINIVVSSTMENNIPGVRVARDVEEALRLGDELAQGLASKEVVIMGGGELYKQTIESVDELLLTRLPLDIEGDTYFPDIPDNLDLEQLSSAPLEITYDGNTSTVVALFTRWRVFEVGSVVYNTLINHIRNIDGVNVSEVTDVSRQGNHSPHTKLTGQRYHFTSDVDKDYLLKQITLRV